MRLYEYFSNVNDEKKLIDYLISHRVICEKINCPRCNSSISLSHNINCLIFHCHSVHYKRTSKKKRLKTWCNFKISALHGTCCIIKHYVFTKSSRYSNSMSFHCLFFNYSTSTANVFRARIRNIIKNSCKLGKFCREVCSIISSYIKNIICIKIYVKTSKLF